MSIEPTSADIILRTQGQLRTVPAIIVDAGDGAARRFLEFFTAIIRNPNMRAAYARAVAPFLRWCDGRKRALRDIEPMAVISSMESHPGSVPTKEQHLAAIKGRP